MGKQSLVKPLTLMAIVQATDMLHNIISLRKE